MLQTSMVINLFIHTTGTVAAVLGRDERMLFMLVGRVVAVESGLFVDAMLDSRSVVDFRFALLCMCCNLNFSLTCLIELLWPPSDLDLRRNLRFEIRDQDVRREIENGAFIE